MTTVDDLGRRAAQTALVDTFDVDVERGLAEVHAAAPAAAAVEPYEAYGTRSRRTPWIAIVASLVVVAGSAVALARLSGNERRTVVPVDSGEVPGTAPAPGATTGSAPAEPANDDPTTTDPATTRPTTTDATTTAPDPTTIGAAAGYTVETLGIPSTCDPVCTSLAFDPAGHLFVYDPVAATLQITGPAPRTVDISSAGLNPEVSYLELVDDDQVAYFVTQPVDAQDPIGDLVAVATAGPRTGHVVASADGIDLSGDTDLVAAPMGVVAVGCCDAAAVRPDPSAEPVLGWYDAAGAQTIDGPPDIRVEFTDGSARVVRRDAGVETSWTIPDVDGYRGMPPLVATADGGAMISLYDPFDPASPPRLVVLHPGDPPAIEERSIDGYRPVRLSPDGSVLVIGSDGGYRLLHLAGVGLPTPVVPDDDLAAAPFVDPSICTITSTTTRPFASTVLRPFAGGPEPPIAIQVIGAPAPSGAAAPFAVVLRYATPPRAPGTDTRPIGDWDVGLVVYANGNGEARWNLPDGTQGYLRSRGLDEAALVGMVERLSARPTDAAVPGFDYDASDAPADLRLVADATATVSGSVGYARCIAPTSTWNYTITTLDGDAAFVFLGVLDRPVPIEVGLVGDDVVTIEGVDDGGRPTVADVVPHRATIS